MFNFFIMSLLTISKCFWVGDALQKFHLERTQTKAYIYPFLVYKKNPFSYKVLNAMNYASSEIEPFFFNAFSA